MSLHSLNLNHQMQYQLCISIDVLIEAPHIFQTSLESCLIKPSVLGKMGGS